MNIINPFGKTVNNYDSGKSGTDSTGYCRCDCRCTGPTSKADGFTANYIHSYQYYEFNLRATR